MISWHTQPYDVANVYNPAFIGELLRMCAAGYADDSGEGMPLVLAFVALPLLLYKDSRSSLMAKRYRYFRTWLDETPEVRVALAERARELRTFVQLGVAFALQHQAIRLDGEGELHAQPRAKPTRKGIRPPKDAEHFKAAYALGRLLRQGGQLHNVFIALGVRP